MFFEADVDQISQLDSMQLVQLMKRLILAECHLVDIPLRAATVPLQITVADGGEDGRVEWIGGVDATDFFPTRFCVFQSKAQNLTETTISDEVIKKRKKGPAKLNTAMSEALSRRGAYIVFCSHKFGGQKIRKLRNAIESAVRQKKRNPSRLIAIEIYDANRIANWIKTHPAVALWIASLNRGRSAAGFLSHEAWGRENDIRSIPWIADDIPRFTLNNTFSPVGEPQDRNRNLMTFEKAAEAALDLLAKDNAVLRIVGPSGFGKSRFAFEIFNRQGVLFDELERTAVIYADLEIVKDEVGMLALEIADARWPAILVVDDCPDDVHSKLAAIACRADSRLRLVTIDVETKVQDTPVLRLEPASDKTIGSIAHAVAPTLTGADSSFIQEIARGFPRMAVLVARQMGKGGQAIHSAGQVLDRIVWGRRQPIDEAQKALELLSLFEWVGLTGGFAEEGQFIAEKLAGMTQDAFVERILSFVSRGIIGRRKDFVQVEPIPLAASFAAKRLSILPHDRLLTFFLEAPDSLKRSLLRRMRWLDTSSEARTFARNLLSVDQLGKLAILNTDFGAECLDGLVHVDPDMVMATIQIVFGVLSTSELQGVKAGRRHLVWALEKLAFRNETFDVAATLLRRLAASETEHGISNNATGVFKQLYHLYLSGTEANPTYRLLVLDDGLQSSNSSEREVCIDALGKMLETNYFVRGGGVEEIGSRKPLKDWAPKTYQEMWDFHLAAIKRLTDIAIDGDPLASTAKRILGANIRGLIGKLPLLEIKLFISCIVSRHGFWPEALEQVNEWLYFDRKEAPEDLGNSVRAYFDEILPSDPVKLAILYTHGWEADFHDPDIDYDREQNTHMDFDYATRKAIDLAEVIARDRALTEQAIEGFVVSDGKAVFPFARHLAELAPSATTLFETSLAKAEQLQGVPNLDYFCGLIAGADARDVNVARECIRLALNSEKLKKNAISMISAGKLHSDHIQLVISLLRSGEVTPGQCKSLSYGQRMKHLGSQDMAPLLEELVLHGAEGLWAVLHIMAMIIHGGGELDVSLVPILRNVLVAPALFEISERTHAIGRDLEYMTTYLARRGLIEVHLASALVKQLLGICAQKGSNDLFYQLRGPVRNSLKALIGSHPREVWAGISRLLLENDFLISHRVDGLVSIKYDDYLGQGLLYALPADLYLEWVRKAPEHRAFRVMQWLPIAVKHDNGSLSWHPALASFISEFGNSEQVLSTLWGRLHPKSWSGSLAPHLQPQVQLMASWSAHPRREVRQWARDRISWISDRIQEEG